MEDEARERLSFFRDCLEKRLWTRHSIITLLLYHTLVRFEGAY